MGEFQTIATVVMSLVIGFVIGRSSKPTNDYRNEYLTQEELAQLQPDTKHNPYDDVHPDVLYAIKSNNRIQAIKLFRQYHGSSLKEAKNAVEAIGRALS